MKKLLLLALSLCTLGASQALAEEKWGYDLSGEFTISGYNQAPDGPVSDAMFVPGNGELKGARIVAIELPIVSSDLTNIKVWAANNIPEYSEGVPALVHEQAYNKSVTGNTYERVNLTTPWEIPESGFYIGFTYTTSYGYPVARCEGSVEGSTWDNLWMGMWFEEPRNVSAIHIIVDKMSISGSEVEPTSATTRRTEKNTQSSVKVGVFSTSGDPVTSVDYTIKIGNQSQTGTATCNVAAGLKVAADIDLPFTAPATAGEYDMTVTLNKINGTDNLSKTSVGCKLTVVNKLVPRYTIVEEYTGTWCGWCPRGWLGMEKVKEQLSDIAGVIAVHHFNSTDPMYCPNYAKLEWKGAPDSQIDRRALNVEPYYGEGSGIVKAVEKYNDVEAEAAVSVQAHFANANATEVVATATTEFIKDLPGAQIAFVLTADDMSGTTDAWKQNNDYGLGKTPEQGELSIFCPGGKYGESVVYLTYNDVMVGSSWNQNGVNQAPAFSSTANGNKEDVTCTVSISLARQGQMGLKKDKIYMTALVIDANGQIANAARCHVEGAETTAVEAIATEKSEQSSVYDLQGRRQVKPAQGLYIQGGRKVLR